MLQRYEGRIPDHAALKVQAQTLRERYRTTDIHAGLGEQSHTGRAAGGMSLPSGYKPPIRKEGLLASMNSVGA